jgi:hypothetical protein
MAGDWIKMRASLQTDPKVIAIGRHLCTKPAFSRWLSYGQYDDVTISDGALRHCVTGALHAVWCAANEHIKDDTLPGIDLEWIDLVSGIDGFGEAMQKVGWAKVTDDGLLFPKFDLNNTSGADRQKRYRDRNKSDVTRDVTRDGQSDVTRDKKSDGALRPREEKRRREKRREEECVSESGDDAENAHTPTDTLPEEYFTGRPGDTPAAREEPEKPLSDFPIQVQSEAEQIVGLFVKRRYGTPTNVPSTFKRTQTLYECAAVLESRPEASLKFRRYFEKPTLQRNAAFFHILKELELDARVENKRAPPESFDLSSAVDQVLKRSSG